jgi:D-alanyl-lipoteichoic acid acyltransferase DltB (MBOAT superfamily)
MLFPEFDFLYFFFFVLVFNWILKKWKTLWQIFLLLVSYLFYSFFSKEFLFFLIFVTLVNYFLGFLIFQQVVQKRNRKNLFLLTAIVFNFFVLFIFKYYDFFRSSFEILFSRLKIPFFFPVSNIVLPLGLSFYLFRILSFHFEILEQKIFPYPNLLEFSLFVAFFPYLLSGPIVRASEFLPQLREGLFLPRLIKGTKDQIENFYTLVTLIGIGLFKKLIISTWLSTELVDDVFSVPENHSFLTIFLSVISYALVIYCDFSGYSDLSIGFAGLLGFKTPINFNYPYLASNLKEFWRRWHITLSNFARDYIYIPLGGNRKGILRKYFNLLVVMIFIGLWHGPTLNFILWGFLQSLGLIFTHFLEDFNIFSFKKWKILSTVSTFIFVSLTWIFFGTKNIENCIGVFKGLFFPQTFFEPIKLYLIFLILIGLFFIILEQKIFNTLLFIENRLPSLIVIPCFLLIFVIIYKLAPDTVPPFIYFNF